MDLILDIVTHEDALEKKMTAADDTARLLSCGTQDGYLENLAFLEKWHKDDIPGEKVTLSLYESDNDIRTLVGVLRIWRSPYCEDKWLLEGLEIALDKRRQGYGHRLVEAALTLLREKGIKTAYLNINSRNKVSHQLAIDMGFEQCSTGCTNSFGHELTTSNHYKYDL